MVKGKNDLVLEDILGQQQARAGLSCGGRRTAGRGDSATVLGGSVRAAFVMSPGASPLMAVSGGFVTTGVSPTSLWWSAMGTSWERVRSDGAPELGRDQAVELFPDLGGALAVISGPSAGPFRAPGPARSGR